MHCCNKDLHPVPHLLYAPWCHWSGSNGEIARMVDRVMASSSKRYEEFEVVK